ncbi:SH3 domain-containing protein [Chloroflexota bacterium]
MKKRISATLVVALLVALLSMVGMAAAEDCTGDLATFQACFHGDTFTVMLLKSDLQGQMAGEFTTAMFPYAAANFAESENVYMTSATGDELYTDLYYTGKIHQADGSWVTTWTAVIHDANGTPLVYGAFERKNVYADASATLPFVPGSRPVPGAGEVEVVETMEIGGEPAAVVAAGVQTVPYGEDWEPTIVVAGTVQECLVRSNYTVRLRQAPTTAAPILDSVPFDSSMPSDMRTVDDEWVRVYYVGEGGVGQLGWVSADYVDQSEACRNIALAAPIGSGETVVVTGVVTTQDVVAVVERDNPEVLEDPTLGGLVDLTVVEPGTVPECLVRSNYTVRLRLAPSKSAPIADNVPYRTSMPSDLMTTDSKWVRANYLGVLGWVDTGYLTLSDACADLNKIAPVE